MSEKIKNLVQLMRLDKPIGIYLLLWPTLWALWLAKNSAPTLHNLIIFVLGVILMRSAGCIINDYADRNFDAHVSRTKNRPLATGKVTIETALILFFFLLFVAFLLVLTTNLLTLQIACFALTLAVLYPFMKRFTHLPQVMLGAAFSSSILMAYAAQVNQINTEAIILFTANMIWVISYDTEYAMADKTSDIKIGIHSTAILFGKFSIPAICILQILFLLLMVIIGIRANANPLYYISLLFSQCFFVYQIKLLQQNNEEKYLQAFYNNHKIGATIFLGILLM